VSGHCARLSIVPPNCAQACLVRYAAGCYSFLYRCKVSPCCAHSPYTHARSCNTRHVCAFALSLCWWYEQLLCLQATGALATYQLRSKFRWPK
jgi:hypothetical protein